MKKNRQEKLLEVISRYEIDTQDELIAILRDHGYDVTQATVSRDIRELKITKMPTGKGTYRYVLPKHSEKGQPMTMKLGTTLIDSIVSVDSACNIVVIKTYAGLASAVAAGIDHMNLNQVLGCVAGDDTIMIVSRDEEAASAISTRLRTLMNA